MDKRKDILPIVSKFVDSHCKVCNGTGRTTYISGDGKRAVGVVCECAQRRYRKRMETTIQEPCVDCGAVSRFCDHRPPKLIAYALRKIADGSGPKPEDSKGNTSPVSTGMPTLP